MGIVINKGTEFWRNDRLYQVTKKLGANRFEARHHNSDSDVLTLNSYDIPLLVDRGDIEFVTRGIGGNVIPFHDLAGIPEKDRKEVERREKYVLKALEYTRYDQTVVRMENAIEEVAEELSEIVVKKGEKPKKRKKSHKKQRKAPSVRTLYRWMNAYIKSGQNIRSLISDRRVQDRKSSLKPQVLKIIDDLIHNFYLRSYKITAERLHDEIRIAIADENMSIPSNKREKLLTVPHINTIYRHIKKLDGYEVAKSRYGAAYAKYKYRVIGKGKEPTRPMEVVQIDHTTLDLFIVDTRTRLPMGRPTITVMIDRKSRTICGFHVGFDKPSYLSDMYCMYNAFSSKAYVAEKYPSIKNTWLNHGLCERVIVDNGKDFESNDFIEAGRHLGFTITHSPPREPWHKGVIERYFRTLNTRLVDSKPGSIFTKILNRFDQTKAGYNPQKDAVLDLNDFLETLHMWIIDDYHQNFHDNLMDVPQEVWKAATEEYTLIQVPSKNDLHVVLGKTYRRKIQRNGIQFKKLLYNDKKLVMLREKFEGQKVKFKLNPADISVIYIHDEALNIFHPVPCTEPEYTQGLSLWQHKVVMRRAREKYHKVDRLALAKTRREIDQIVERAWGKSMVTARASMAHWNNERQHHMMPQTVSTIEDQQQFMSEDELLNAAPSPQAMDFDAANQPIPFTGRVHTHNHAEYDRNEHYNGDHRNYDDPDDDALDTFDTNQDTAA
jgi:putative transposase